MTDAERPASRRERPLSRADVLAFISDVRAHDGGGVPLAEHGCACSQILDELVDSDKALRVQIGTLRAKLRAWIDAVVAYEDEESGGRIVIREFDGLVDETRELLDDRSAVRDDGMVPEP